MQTNLRRGSAALWESVLSSRMVLRRPETQSLLPEWRGHLPRARFGNRDMLQARDEMLLQCDERDVLRGRYEMLFQRNWHNVLQRYPDLYRWHLQVRSGPDDMWKRMLCDERAMPSTEVLQEPEDKLQRDLLRRGGLLSVEGREGLLQQRLPMRACHGHRHPWHTACHDLLPKRADGSSVGKVGRFNMLSDWRGSNPDEPA